MIDLSVIILTYNEELHIRRCLENVKVIAKQILIIDSFSTDKTLEIAKEYGAIILQNKWENNHAKQLNWGLANAEISTKWILRIDADEYLTPQLITEINQRLPNLPENVAGVIFKRRHIFLGRWMKRGTYPVMLLRLFQNKKGIFEQRLMDEHLILLEGKAIKFDNDFVDHNLNDLGWWISKHNGYSIREAADLLDIEFNLSDNDHSYNDKGSNSVLLVKNKKMNKYIRLPLFWRSFLYFIMRYIIKGGFLEGKEGFLWYFFQAWWYRTLVDARLCEIKKACGNDKGKIVSYLKEKYNIDYSGL